MGLLLHIELACETMSLQVQCLQSMWQMSVKLHTHSYNNHLNLCT